MPLHRIINFPPGFDSLPAIKFSFSPGCEMQEITGSPMRLFVVIEQVKEAISNKK